MVCVELLLERMREKETGVVREGFLEEVTLKPMSECQGRVKCAKLKGRAFSVENQLPGSKLTMSLVCFRNRNTPCWVRAGYVRKNDRV